MRLKPSTTAKLEEQTLEQILHTLCTQQLQQKSSEHGKPILSRLASLHPESKRWTAMEWLDRTWGGLQLAYQRSSPMLSIKTNSWGRRSSQTTLPLLYPPPTNMEHALHQRAVAFLAQKYELPATALVLQGDILGSMHLTTYYHVEPLDYALVWALTQGAVESPKVYPRTPMLYENAVRDVLHHSEWPPLRKIDPVVLGIVQNIVVPGLPQTRLHHDYTILYQQLVDLCVHTPVHETYHLPNMDESLGSMV